jgi:RNA polymerase sigma-70 factor (ECF subfamily)
MNWIEKLCVNQSPTPEELLVRKQRTLRLHAAIRTLTPTQRRRLIAYFYEDKNYRQIAEQEGVSHKAITGSNAGALKKLRRYEY